MEEEHRHGRQREQEREERLRKEQRRRLQQHESLQFEVAKQAEELYRVTARPYPDQHVSAVLPLERAVRSVWSTERSCFRPQRQPTWIWTHNAPQVHQCRSHDVWHRPR